MAATGSRSPSPSGLGSSSSTRSSGSFPPSARTSSDRAATAACTPPSQPTRSHTPESPSPVRRPHARLELLRVPSRHPVSRRRISSHRPVPRDRWSALRGPSSRLTRNLGQHILGAGHLRDHPRSPTPVIARRAPPSRPGTTTGQPPHDHQSKQHDARLPGPRGVGTVAITPHHGSTAPVPCLPADPPATLHRPRSSSRYRGSPRAMRSDRPRLPHRQAIRSSQPRTRLLLWLVRHRPRPPDPNAHPVVRGDAQHLLSAPRWRWPEPG
jgi:hypothetical protein